MNSKQKTENSPQSKHKKTVVKRNQRQSSQLNNKTIQQLFCEQALKSPDSIALCYGDKSLTYAQLDERSNQIAHSLQEQGVGPDTLVAIMFERSIEMIVSLLGILKSGGAYVPLDPDYPDERLIYMLTDSKVSILLTQKRLNFHLDSSKVKIAYIDEQAEIFEQYSNLPVRSDVTMDHLAYVIYTSGSTGKPKGVAIEHRSLVNYLLWCRDTYPTTETKSSLLHGSIAFDMSITSIFTPLISGSRLEILLHGDNTEQLSLLLAQKKQFNFLKLTPSQMQALQYLNKPIASEIDALIFGGEILTDNVVSFCARELPKTVVYNEYGPTEATVACTLYRAPNPTQAISNTILVGKPIANTQIYIINEQMELATVGTIGELCISGLGLARGYLNQSDLTSQKFLINPFVKNSKTRLYRTGDSARYLPDGNIELFGRVDNQVKINGSRVELGEIEKVLVTHPAVRESVVITRDEKIKHKQIIAYITVHDNHEVAPVELRGYLEKKLPNFMIPSIFSALENLPLTPNGKIDRHILAKSHETMAVGETSNVAAKTAIEKQLVSIWQEILGINLISIENSFFELGGHSLNAMQVMLHIQKSFEVTLALHEFFEHSTIAKLAILIEQKQQSSVHKKDKLSLAHGRVSDMFRPLSSQQ